MAKCFAPPEHINPPEYDGSITIEAHQNKEKAFVERAREFCVENSKCKDAGEIITFPMGDGYAQYMVLTYTQLVFLQIGDAWNIPEAHMRGLRVADVKEMIAFVKRRRKSGLFGS